MEFLISGIAEFMGNGSDLLLNILQFLDGLRPHGDRALIVFFVQTQQDHSYPVHLTQYTIVQFFGNTFLFIVFSFLHLSGQWKASGQRSPGWPPVAAVRSAIFGSWYAGLIIIKDSDCQQK